MEGESFATEPGSTAPEGSQAAPSSDLFDGELFGDELIDIYNAAVGDGAPTQANDEEIPALPPQPETTNNEDGKAPDLADMHPGARVAETAAKIDDGLGAFRPSTSFNDLTTLLTPSGPPATATVTAAPNTKAHVPPNSTKTPTIPSVAPPTSVPKPAVVNAPAVSVSTNPTAVPSTVAPKRKAPTSLAPAPVKKQAVDVAIPLPPNKPIAAPSIQSTAPVVLAKASVAPVTHSNAPQQANHSNPAIVKSTAKAPDVPVSAPATTTNKPPAAAAAKEPGAVPEAAVSTQKAGEKPPKNATESDFQTLAQAAVSSLITSTKTGEVPTGKTEAEGLGLDFDIDTSTAHIKALTGSNWVAACSGAGVATGCVAAPPAADPKGNNRSKRQNLTADERARQNRDRNREHARNTRLRKKAYVEELKRTLTVLVAQRDKAELEKTQASQRETEQREVRFRVIEEFLKIRGRNETNYAIWDAILDGNFSLTVPATDFRAMYDGAITSNSNSTGVRLEKTFSGVVEAMNEASIFAAFLQSLGGEGTHYEPVGFVFNCDRKNFFMDGSHAVLDWSAGTVGLTKRGAQNELSVRGSVRASFCPASNKLLSGGIMFDTGAVLSQLQTLLPAASTSYDTSAAQEASRADAILDSLQMPHLNKPVGATIVPQSESSDEGS